MKVSPPRLFFLIAVILFVLAYFGLNPGGRSLIPLGLAFGFAGLIV